MIRLDKYQHDFAKTEVITQFRMKHDWLKEGKLHIPRPSESKAPTVPESGWTTFLHPLAYIARCEFVAI
jgi:hypothetical protein